MQIKFFMVPIQDDGSGAEELNRFLHGRRVLEIERQFVMDGGNSCWCFCIRYLEGSSTTSYSERGKRIDYREILDAATFAKFAELRARRKELAENDGVPAYAVFTDEQLAEMAKLPELTLTTLATVKGVGAGKIERYAARLLATSGENPPKGQDGDNALPASENTVKKADQ